MNTQKNNNVLTHVKESYFSEDVNNDIEVSKPYEEEYNERV